MFAWISSTASPFKLTENSTLRRSDLQVNEKLYWAKWYRERNPRPQCFQLFSYCGNWTLKENVCFRAKSFVYMYWVFTSVCYHFYSCLNIFSLSFFAVPIQCELTLISPFALKQIWLNRKWLYQTSRVYRQTKLANDNIL